MNIEFIPDGNTARVVIHSFITERRKLIRLVDAALLHAPVHETSAGVFFRTTVIYGRQNHVRRAYKIISREASL